MINRVLIRIKVMQLTYSYYKNDNRSLATAETELMFSLEKSYELYNYLLLLMVELTQFQGRRLDAGRNKLLPTEENKNPNTRFIDNRFIRQLNENVQFKEYLNNQKISWANEQEFVRILLDRIIESKTYADYMSAEEDSYEADREFWRSTFKNIIIEDADLAEVLEGNSLYWNDDIDIIGTFVLKTIKQFNPAKGEKQSLLPMFKAEDDREFAITLFRKAILCEKEYRELIDKHTQNWEMDRIAFMDIIVMQIALAEIFNFESIPTNVTLNEYIELAKTYSTPKSGYFVNGVLNNVINQLKSEKRIVKN